MTKVLSVSILSFLLFCSCALAAAPETALTQEEFDTNKDGKTDKIVYKDSDNIIRKQVWDIGSETGPKKMDFFYDNENKLDRAESDTNDNGIVDMHIKYKNGLMSEVSRDKNEDGKPEFWGFYQGGVLEHTEVDGNGDGKPDEWFYYVGQQVVRHDKDTNFDGKPDSEAAYKKGKLKIEMDTDFDGKTDRSSI